MGEYLHENEVGMALRTILFDLDGTLLPMDQDEFVRGYFKLLAQKLAPHGYEAKTLINAVWAGTAAMIQNDGSQSNESAFWKRFAAVLGDKVYGEKILFENFYANEFGMAKQFCGSNPAAAETVKALKEKGFQLALATNPIFPTIATEQRIAWAGLHPTDFALYTTYENASYSKPNPAYYQQILDKLGTRAEDCLMVGNDTTDDTAPEKLGMQIFLLTDCLINEKNKDISGYPQGSFADLMAYVEQQEKE